MPRPADILLPILGAIAGTNPYLASGIHTGATVSEAMRRRRQDTLGREQEVATQQAEQERKQWMAQRLADLFGTDSPQARAMQALILGSDNPASLSGEIMNQLAPPKPEKPGPRVWTDEEWAAQVDRDAAGLGAGESASVSANVGGRNIQRTIRKPAEQQPKEAKIHTFTQGGKLGVLTINPDGTKKVEWPNGPPPEGKANPKHAADMVDAQADLEDAEAELIMHQDRQNGLMTMGGEPDPKLVSELNYKISVASNKVKRARNRLDRLKAEDPNPPQAEAPMVASHGGPAKPKAAPATAAPGAATGTVRRFDKQGREIR